MQAFETNAILDDASHLTLHQPVPGASVKECRVIVLFEVKHDAPTAWPAGFFNEIRITDPAFGRPEQGELPPAPDLES